MDRDMAGGSAGPFGAVDAKLNIFALANGLDLKREAAARQLEWHRDRLERGIRLDLSDVGTYTVSAMAWNHGDPSSVRKEVRYAGLDANQVAADLSAILQTTLDAANAL